MTSLPEPDPVAYYLPGADGTFVSTFATTSPWDAGQQHGGPPSALLARAVENCEPRADMAIARISIDFLGAIPQGVMSIETSVLRPGRRIELIEAVLTVAGRRVAVGRAWRSQVAAGSAVSVPTAAEEVVELPEPQEQRYFPGVSHDWGYGRATEWRFVDGGYDTPGPAVVWARPRLPLVAGEEIGGVQRALVVADSVNGLSNELDIAEWLFIPPTVTATFVREPIGEWILLDAHTVIDARGTGLAHGEIHDRQGLVGMVTQPLLVQRR